MRLAAATVWLLGGAAMTAGTYWAFLNTPESTVWALLLSAVLLVAAVAFVGLTANGAIDIWINGPSVAGVKRAWRRIPAVVPAAFVVWLFWWIAVGIDTWVALRTGEINAWFIARFGWDDMSRLFTAIRYATTWLRWVVGPVLALSLLTGMAAVGWRAIARVTWIGRALRPRTLLVATLWFVALVVLPWLYLVPWRPSWVPPTSIELTFIVFKLSIASVLIAIGVALIIYEALGIPPRPTDPRSAVVAA